MTCIIGIVDENGNVHMASDSCASNGWDYHLIKEPKVFKLENETESMIFGYTSSFRFGQLIKFHVTLPDKKRKDSDLGYIVNRVIPVIRAALKNGGYTAIVNSEEKGGVCLIGYNGKLYTMQSDFSIIESCMRFDACGCGALKATSVLHYINNGEEAGFDGYDIAFLLEEVMEAVENVDSHVKLPVHYELLNKEPIANDALKGE